LGEATRYDGGHKKSKLLTNLLSKVFKFIPVCPEVDIGLPVPREPIELVQTTERIKLFGVVDRKLDVTTKMARHSRKFARNNNQICGLVVKSGSPSCASKSARVYRSGQANWYGRDGLFTQVFQKATPLVPVIDERGLNKPNILLCFIEAALSYHELLLMDESKNSSAIVKQNHAKHRMLVRSRSASAEATLGKIVELDPDPKRFFDKYIVLFMKTVNRRASPKSRAKAMLFELERVKGKLDKAQFNRTRADIEKYSKKLAGYLHALSALKQAAIDSGDVSLKSQSCFQYPSAILSAIEGL
jgi:uncharacterized protein YbbK (DUF523 family)/uncharacterized protein YbgA (DUF1722 family)